ncbi:MAG TPA: NAD(P)-dependent oxidoreductase, partial [Solirubrobacterales bacterium]|nr:NAD(P)-dependent oxidoreductase [Solirubrobacterales bacterium]
QRHGREPVDEDLLSKMKRGAYLVNTARGKICERDAVARALTSASSPGYAGDVWFPQPAPTPTARRCDRGLGGGGSLPRRLTDAWFLR